MRNASVLSERLCRKPEAFGIEPPVEAQLNSDELTLDLVIVEDLRREGLDPLSIPKLVVHLAREDASFHPRVVEPPVEPVSLDDHVGVRVRRGRKRRRGPLDHYDPIGSHVTPTRRQKDRALLPIRRVHELACQEHHGEGPTEIKRLDIGEDDRCSSNVRKHLRRLVHADNGVAELHEPMRDAACTAAEFQDLRTWRNGGVHDFRLAGGRGECVQLNRATVRRAWSRRTHGFASLVVTNGTRTLRESDQPLVELIAS